MVNYSLDKINHTHFYYNSKRGKTNLDLGALKSIDQEPVATSNSKRVLVFARGMNPRKIKRVQKALVTATYDNYIYRPRILVEINLLRS